MLRVPGMGDNTYRRGNIRYCINLSDFRRVEDIKESNGSTNPNPWISTRNKLPDKIGRYLTYAEHCNNHNIDDEEMRFNVLYFDGKEWYNGECIYYDVLYWMPLPKSPVG